MQLTAYGEIPVRAEGLLAERPGIAQSSIWLGMKLTAILLLAAFLQVSANGLSQGITLNVKKGSLEKVMAEIERQSGYHFLYTKTELDKSRDIDVTVYNVDLITALAACFQDQPFQYNVVGNNIVLKMNTPPPPAGLVANFFRWFQAAPQQATFRGKVVNDQGKPLEDAAVMIKGSRHSVYADRSGIFEIEGVTVGSVLVISYPGYVPVEFTVKTLERPAALDKILPAGLRMYVVLQPNKTGLDEMQVIAYGRVSKRFNTGDVTTIKAEDIAKNPVNNVLEALQGRVTGMFIQQATGAPGGNFNVQVRGQSSFQVTQPLYVIDGVVYPANAALPMLNPIYSANQTQGTQLQGGNALNYFDPSLIESVEVLKDADATSIYGSRGAYGVILITTKKGKPGIPRLTINSYVGVTTRGVSPKLLNTPQYLMLRREAIKNDNGTPGPADLDLNGTWDTTAYTDWKNEFIGHQALTTSTSATYSGGMGNTSYLIGANYKKQGNIQRNIGSVSGGGLNFNVNTGSFNQKFTLSLSGSYSSTVNNMLPNDLSSQAAGIAPNHPSLYLPNGKLDWTNGANPASGYALVYNDVTNNLLSTALFRYAPIPGLAINASVGYNYFTNRELYAVPSTIASPLVYANPGTQANSQMQLLSSSTVNFDPYIDYSLRLGRGKLDVTAGASFQSGQSYINSVNGSNYSTDAQIRNPAAGVTVISNYTTNPNRQEGFFARVNYIWDQKYVLNLSGRRDGSTKFGSGSQFGNFGSVGAAWLFGEERWIKRHLQFLSFGKLRGSYGTTGGDNISNYAYLSTYSVSNNGYQGGLSIFPNNIANPYLHWETNTKKEIALELRFLKDRIWVEAAYYHNRSSNQLISQPLSVVTGFGGISQNSPALVQNSGFEGQLTTVNIQSKNFSWKTVFNISINRNKLLRYPGADENPLILQNSNWVVGKPLTNTKLYDYKGIDPQTGQYFYTNAKGETGPFTYLLSPTQLTFADKTVNKDLNPKYFGGLDNTFSYKGFTLDVFFTFTSRTGKNYYGQQFILPGLMNVVGTTGILQRWQKPGDITNVPKLGTGFSSLLQQFNFQNSSGAYSNATYARLQNLYLSYVFKPAFLKKAHIAGLTLFLQGQNLLTISQYKDLDPENLSAGAMGPLKVYTAGINITL